MNRKLCILFGWESRCFAWIDQFIFVGSIFPLAPEVVSRCMQSLSSIHAAWKKFELAQGFARVHQWTCQMMKFHEKVRFQAPEGSQKCKIALLTQSWSSHGLPNVTRRDGSTSWRIIFLCQRACCVASEPHTMYTFRTEKIYFSWIHQFYLMGVFAACH